MRLRTYNREDKDVCLAIFSTNVPEYFASQEMKEYEEFLENRDDPYFVVEGERGEILACGGYHMNGEERIASLSWGIVKRERHRRGVGFFLLLARLQKICLVSDGAIVKLNTSQHSYGFFEKAGFVVKDVRENGYAPGLHRIEMMLRLDKEIVGELQKRFMK